MAYSLESLTLFLMIGIVFFCVSVIAMVILFGISTADLLKKPREMIFLLFISLALPVSLAAVSSRTFYFTLAASRAQLTSYRINRAIPRQITVEFVSDRPAYGYLEYWDANTGTHLPISPAYPLELRTHHEVVITGTLPSSVWIAINGQKVKELRF